jgi:hypothetical protein
MADLSACPPSCGLPPPTLGQLPITPFGFRLVALAALPTAVVLGAWLYMAVTRVAGTNFYPRFAIPLLPVTVLCCAGRARSQMTRVSVLAPHRRVRQPAVSD